MTLAPLLCPFFVESRIHKPYNYYRPETLVLHFPLGNDRGGEKCYQRVSTNEKRNEN